MKKYITCATRRLLLFTLMSALALIIGMILMAVDFPNIGVAILLTVGGGLAGILLFCCYLAEKSRALILDKDKIVFPRGASKNGKTVFSKTIVRTDDIRAVESVFHKGDGIVAGDAYFHTLRLKDDSTLTVTLYAYGKDAETEILETIRNGIV